MKRRALARALGAGLLASVALPAASCAKVIGVDASSYSDAVSDLCRCDAVQSALEVSTSDACSQALSARVRAASPDVVSAWLQRFSDDACFQCDTPTAQPPPCFYAAPACATSACATSQDCCGWANRKQDCRAGACAACVAPGAGCSKTSQCCGGADGAAICRTATGTCAALCDPTNSSSCDGCCVRDLVDKAYVCLACPAGKSCQTALTGGGHECR